MFHVKHCLLERRRFVSGHLKPPWRSSLFCETSGVLIDSLWPSTATRGTLQFSTSVAEHSLGLVAVNTTRRPRVVMMCGPGGAGKTTYAKRLEREGWTRLSFEVEFWDRGLTTMPSTEWSPRWQQT